MAHSEGYQIYRLAVFLVTLSIHTAVFLMALCIPADLPVQTIEDGINVESCSVEYVVDCVGNDVLGVNVES